jgi:hypothetical protein
MQEEVLSQRIYCFVNNQIFYRCKRNEYGEIMTLPGQDIFTLPAYTRSSLYPLLFDPEIMRFGSFTAMITYFGLRKLSYDADILRAAQGMIQHYSMLSKQTVIEGLPTPLSQSLLFSTMAAHLLSEGHSEARTERRCNFPSYSWTGWSHNIASWPDKVDTEVVSDQTFGNGKHLTHSVKSVSINQPVLRTWVIFGIVGGGKSSLINSVGTVVHAACSDIQSALSQCPLEFGRIPVVDTQQGVLTHSALKPYTLLHFWTVCINLTFQQGLGLVNNFGWTCGTVDFDTDDFDKSLPLKLALIAKLDDRFMALVLKWDEDGIAERRGIATLDQAVLKDSFEPGPRWKEIILG